MPQFWVAFLRNCAIITDVMKSFCFFTSLVLREDRNDVTLIPTLMSTRRSFRRLLVLRIVMSGAVVSLLLILSSCCLPLTPIAACYITPSTKSVQRTVAKAKYTPKEAYMMMTSDIMKEPFSHYTIRGLPMPSFCIIHGKYFFYSPGTEGKFTLDYFGWEFNQHTGKYRPIRSPYVRLFFSCDTRYSRYEIADNHIGFISDQDYFQNFWKKGKHPCKEAYDRFEEMRQIIRKEKEIEKKREGEREEM